MYELKEKRTISCKRGCKRPEGCVSFDGQYAIKVLVKAGLQEVEKHRAPRRNALYPQRAEKRSHRVLPSFEKNRCVLVDIAIMS